MNEFLLLSMVHHHLSELTKATLRQGQAGCKKEVKKSAARRDRAVKKRNLPALNRFFTPLLNRWWSNQHAIHTYAHFGQKDAPIRHSVMRNIADRLACRMRKLLRIER